MATCSYQGLYFILSGAGTIPDTPDDATHIFEKWCHLDEVVRNETPRAGLWIDSSDMTAEETVDVIMRDAWQAAQLA